MLLTINGNKQTVQKIAMSAYSYAWPWTAHSAQWHCVHVMHVHVLLSCPTYRHGVLRAIKGSIDKQGERMKSITNNKHPMGVICGLVRLLLYMIRLHCMQFHVHVHVHILVM